MIFIVLLLLFLLSIPITTVFGLDAIWKKRKKLLLEKEPQYVKKFLINDIFVLVIYSFLGAVQFLLLGAAFRYISLFPPIALYLIIYFWIDYKEYKKYDIDPAIMFWPTFCSRYFIILVVTLFPFLFA